MDLEKKSSHWFSQSVDYNEDRVRVRAYKCFYFKKGKKRKEKELNV